MNTWVKIQTLKTLEGLFFILQDSSIPFTLTQSLSDALLNKDHYIKQTYVSQPFNNIFNLKTFCHQCETLKNISQHLHNDEPLRLLIQNTSPNFIIHLKAILIWELISKKRLQDFIFTVIPCLIDLSKLKNSLG